MTIQICMQWLLSSSISGPDTWHKIKVLSGAHFHFRIKLDLHTFMSLMWRYSSIMDLDFLSSSSSLMAGLAGAGGGGAGADIGFTEKPKQVKRWSICETSTQTSLLLVKLRTVLLVGRLSPVSLLLSRSRLPRSRFSVMLDTRRTESGGPRLSPPLRSSFSRLKLRLVMVWRGLSRPRSRSSRLLSKRSKRSLSRSLRSRSRSLRSRSPRSLLELFLHRRWA